MTAAEILLYTTICLGSAAIGIGLGIVVLALMAIVSDRHDDTSDMDDPI